MAAITSDLTSAPVLLKWIAPVLLLAFAYGVVPLIGSSYLFEAILLPFLALGLAGVGLNILTGYAGQVSLGSAAFMAAGAFAAYNFNLRVEGLPLIGSIVLAGIVAAAIEADPAAAEQIRSGNGKAIGAIVGAVMRETKGRADGGEVNRLIREQLGL